MIDERTRKQIEMYLPNPPDPDLEFDEFYYRQSTMKGEQVIRVKVMGIFPGLIHEEPEYSIYQVWGNGLRYVDVGWNDPFHGCHRYELYDNKQDCKDQTHFFCSDWERLREIQKSEGLI